MIASAEEARKKADYGKALFAYLEAQKLYPASFFVEAGIQEAVDAVLTDRIVVASESSGSGETESP